MISEIERATLALITERIAGLGAVGVQKDVRGLLLNPQVAVAATGGTFTPVGQVNWRQDLNLSVLVTVKQLQGEAQRRAAGAPLALGIMTLLLNQTLELPITRLKPVRWRETTSDEQFNGGFIEYLIEFATSFILTPQDDEQTTELLRIGLNYYLQPDDGAVDAQDNVELQL